MNISFPLRIIGATVLGLAASMSLVARAQTPDSDEINQLFKEMRFHAVEAEYDAELLEAYTRSSITPWAHVNRINQIRLHVQDLAHDFNVAKGIRFQGSEWQKDAIDKVEPVLQEMADHLSASLDYLQANRSRTQMQPWIDYAKGNRVFANKAVKLIGDYVDYGKSRAKAEALQQKLVTPGQG